MAKILKIILAAAVTLFLCIGLFGCLISGAAAVPERKMGNYIFLCAGLCTGLAVFIWMLIWYISRLRKREKELEKQMESLIKQSNKILMKQRDKLDK